VQATPDRLQQLFDPDRVAAWAEHFIPNLILALIVFSIFYLLYRCSIEKTWRRASEGITHVLLHTTREENGSQAGRLCHFIFSGGGRHESE
jgi:hypothetical protein